MHCSAANSFNLCFFQCVMPEMGPSADKGRMEGSDADWFEDVVGGL